MSIEPSRSQASESRTEAGVHLVDTNVVSELMRPRPSPDVRAWAATLERISLSAVTIEEVHFGLSLKKSARLEKWFDGFVRDYCEVLPITESIARRAGVLRARHRAAGATRTQADMLIAATAAEHSLVLATRNERDFVGCGLRVVNPFAP